MNKNSVSTTGLELAVIGMAGRFPGAGNCTELWENLKNGEEAITFFSRQTLEDAGIPPELLENPNYIKAKLTLMDIESFDASFFDYTPREAELLNPQTRIFFECIWETLEDAGYNPWKYNGLIGLYAGAASSFYWEGLSLLSGKGSEIGDFAADNLTNKDIMCTTISYKLNLKGPSCAVQTACSTSLVAIHMACRSVLSGECHIALAGGVTINVRQTEGYLYAEGMIRSPDGHCRAFDARARGTVGGSGAGVVALKRLKAAIADGDHIYAIVKGSAINNDGKQKVGFTAPSVQGQAQVIRTAMAVARVTPESIGYVEAHGTGTELGDPVEIQALTLAFKPQEGIHYKKNSCAIASIKTNLGHLDCAAGVTGFIKTVLVLKNRQIPPSLHFETPNPGIDFKNSPFYVNTKLQEWKSDKYPLRAGVSSFGIGGTNAHVILEEAPGISGSVGQWVSESVRKTSEGTRGLAPLSNRQYQLILLSAKTETALQQMTQNLAAFLKKNPGIDLADLAFTLQAGRAAFRAKRMVASSTVPGLIESLSSPNSTNLRTFLGNDEKLQTIFMFPGQGAQYINMGRELYESEPLFREEMDRCFEILNGLAEYDIKEILYPGDSRCRGGSQDLPGPRNSPLEKGAPQGRGVSPDINQTQITQPVIFAIEYALARLLMHWGIKPYAMIGHSIGEYTAACLAEVFSLEDALKTVVLRGRLMQAMPHGSMLGVQISENRLKELLLPHSALQLSAVNSDTHCVVSGPDDAAAAFEKILNEKGYKCRKIQTSHAFHSKMMEPILGEFEKMLVEISLHKPKIPYISNITGNWITAEEAVSPRYWAAHLRQTVRFADGLDKLLPIENSLFIEIGPGTTLSTFTKQHKRTGNQDNAGTNPPVINLLRHPHENVPDNLFLTDRIGQLWLHGVDIDWNQYNHGEKRYRISLPAYPFEKQSYWIKDNFFNIGANLRTQESTPRRKTDIADWFYIPSWKKTVSPLSKGKKNWLKNKPKWLIFLDDLGIGSLIVEKLRSHGHETVVVLKGENFLQTGKDEYKINIHQPDDYKILIQNLKRENWGPGIIIHLWSVTPREENETGIDWFEKCQETGYYSLIFLAQALEKHRVIQAGIETQSHGSPLRLAVITNQVQVVNDNEEICPEKTTILGPCKTIPQEYGNIVSQNIDIILPAGDTPDYTRLVDQLLAELQSKNPDQVIAYRNHTRWVQTLEPLHLEQDDEVPLKLKEKGVYLITGGLGKDSLCRAKYLAETVKARLILIGRTHLPQRGDWETWLETHTPDDPTSEKIKKIWEIETLGGEVMVIPADVSNEKDMDGVMKQIDARCWTLNGVIHAAGITSIESSIFIAKLGRTESQWHFKPKVYGLYALEKLLKGKSPGFFLLTSSMASFLAGVGLTAYTAANIFMDAFAQKYNRGSNVNWTSLNWIGVSPGETNETFHRILNLESIPQLAVFDYDYERTARQRNRLQTVFDTKDTEAVQSPGKAAPLHKRPATLGPYIQPDGETEKKLAHILERFFGISPMGSSDNFFDLCADSLSALTVIAKIHKELNVELSLAEFFQRHTIKELAAYIDQDTRESTFTALTPSEEKEDYFLSSARERIPLTPNGKVDTSVLPGPKTTAAPEDYLPPRDEIENKLTVIWADVLRMEKEKIGIGHNFFELGGNSSTFKTMVSKIPGEFGCEIPLTQIYHTPFISEISKLIHIKNFGGDTAVILLNKANQKKIFAFPPAIAYGYSYYSLANSLDDYSFYAFSFIEDLEPGTRLKKYADIITDLQPVGPYKLLGYSAGGKITYQVAKTLESRGCVVSDIIYCDCFIDEDKIPLEESENYWREFVRGIDELLKRIGVSFLRSEVIKKAEKYLQYNRSVTCQEKINANVHLILSKNNHESKMQQCWHKLTAKEAIVYKGDGAHDAMFNHGGPLETNTKIIRNILDKSESDSKH